MSILNSFANHMINVDIYRNNQKISSVKALDNRKKTTDKKMFNFYPNVDIKVNDCILVPSTNTKYYVIDIEQINMHGSVQAIDAFVLTEFEYQQTQKQLNSSPVFNIQNATNSVFGNNNSITYNLNENIAELKKTIESSNSEDKEELNKIVSLLEMVVNNQIPASKGLLSKFASTIQKNSWITGPLATTLLSWLLSQI